jgi:hypothetical protein
VAQVPLDDAVIEHHADEDEEHDDDEDQARLVLVGADLIGEADSRKVRG